MLFLRSAIRKMSSLPRENILVLFDVDGTLTPARKTISPEFEEFLYTKIKPKATIGIVGGSDLEKMSEQLNGKRILDEFDYVFPENGLVQIEKGVEVGKVSIQKHLGEEVLQDFLNYALKYLSELKIPVKRGTFIDYRNGMINVSPIGRQCSYEERLAFNKYDDENQKCATSFFSFLCFFQVIVSGEFFPRKRHDSAYCGLYTTKIVLNFESGDNFIFNNSFANSVNFFVFSMREFSPNVFSFNQSMPSMCKRLSVGI